MIWDMLLLLVPAVAFLVFYRKREDRLREASLQVQRRLALDRMRAFIRPGMRRDEVDRLLMGDADKLTQRTNYNPPSDTGKLYDLFLLVDRDESGVIYCNFLDHSVEIEFRATEAHADDEMARGSDVVRDVQPYEQWMDCL